MSKNKEKPIRVTAADIGDSMSRIGTKVRPDDSIHRWIVQIEDISPDLMKHLEKNLSKLPIEQQRTIYQYVLRVYYAVSIAANRPSTLQEKNRIPNPVGEPIEEVEYIPLWAPYRENEIDLLDPKIDLLKINMNGD